MITRPKEAIMWRPKWIWFHISTTELKEVESEGTMVWSTKLARPDNSQIKRKIRSNPYFRARAERRSKKGLTQNVFKIGLDGPRLGLRFKVWADFMDC
jgi:hypothetical protein